MNPRLVVISDLHLGMGRRPEASGRYHRLESFFFDREFLAFIHWLLKDSDSLRLVLNGDVIDFLRNDTLRAKGQETQVSSSEHPHKHGYGFTVEATVWRAEQVTKAHDRFFRALALVLDAGHELIWLPGNHDPEIRLPEVQEVIRAAIAETLDDPDAIQRLIFRPWFHYEEGRVWIEHGNAADPENAFAYPLSRVALDPPCACFGDELDMPLGSWFQRYVYNGLGHITFQVPAASAHRAYAFWLLLNRPHRLWRLMRSHGPLWRRVLYQVCTADHGPLLGKLRESHTSTLEQVSQASAIPLETLKHLRGKAPGVTPPSKVLRELLGRATRGGVLAGSGLLAATLGLTALVLALLGSPLSGPLKALILSGLILLAAGGFWGLVAALWVTGVRPESEALDGPRSYAKKIARTTGVPNVLLGHFHTEDRQALETGGVYLNTGTWIPVWNPGDTLRERVQFTFADIQNEAVLRYWDPQGPRVRRVILMDQDE